MRPGSGPGDARRPCPTRRRRPVERARDVTLAGGARTATWASWRAGQTAGMKNDGEPSTVHGHARRLRDARAGGIAVAPSSAHGDRDEMMTTTMWSYGGGPAPMERGEGRR